MLKNRDTNYTFNNILSEGYIIQENIRKEVRRATMGNGSIRINYEPMPKTKITVTFGRLSATLLTEYLNNLIDGRYEYWSIKDNTLKEAEFKVDTPELTMVYNQGDKIIDEITVELEMVNV